MNKYFDFLDKLRASGETNMFGAVPHLQSEFPELASDPEFAKELLKDWMLSFSEREENRRKEETELREAAAHVLAAHFGIDLEEDDDSQPGALQLFEDTFGFSISEAVNDSSEYCLLPHLVAQYREQAPAIGESNHVWEDIVNALVESRRSIT